MVKFRWWLKNGKAAPTPPQETDQNPIPPNPPSHANTDPDPSENPPNPSFPDGVKVLRDCPDSTVDICFIHGLTGDRESTWTANGQAAPWPRTLLPRKLSTARILTYGYDAYIVRKGVAGSNRLIDHATNLLHDLTADRSSSHALSRPLIFVAHSLGGLVCKKAILLSRNNPEAHLRSIFDCTEGIIFMGTPHKGSWMADWAKIPASAIGQVKSANKSLLGILETDDQLLESIQVEFWSMVRGLREGGRRFEVTCFFEELPLPVVGKVVSKESATLEGYASFSIHANHSDMVKFASVDENGFKRLLGELVRWASQVRHPRASQTEELLRTSLSSAEGDRGTSSVNYYDSSTQSINSITTGSGPVNIAQHQTIYQTIAVPEASQDCLRSLAFRSRMKRGDPPSPAAYCNDPAFIKKVDLIGRNEQLTNIRSHLSDVKAQGKQGWVCLWGPGGIGKTQLAATYALESRSLYSQMFKVSGTSPEFIQEEFARLVEKQSKKSPEDPNGHDSIPEWPPDDSPPEFRQRALQQRVEMAHNWFQAHKEWLLVIDDARLSHVDLPHYIPPTNHGDIIITTQTRHAVSRGLFEIPPLSVGDAVTLLLNKAGKRDQQSRDSARPRATEIVELLGCLPLAVEHAGALIGIKGIPYFWVTFHSSPITVLDQSDMMAAHRESVFRTFKMSFDVLKEQNRCAAKFLVFLAFLDNTTISTDAFFDEYGVPKPSLKHMGLFKTKLEFHEAMGALRSSALIKNNENEDDKEVLLHPLVHHMTRARLPTAYLTSWTGNAADYLCWPLVQPQPVSTEIQVSPFDFKSILQVMRQAAELDVPQPPTDTFLRLWHVLGYMLLRYVSCWHAYGKHEQLEQYAKRAIMVLEQHTDPQVQLVVGSLVVVVSAITSYTRSSETSESVAKSFLSKYLRPAAAMALQRAADRGIAPPECFEPVRFVWTYKPRTLRAAFKSNTPENVISGLGRYFSELAKLCAGRNHWHEALVLAQFAEVPASLWGKPPNRLPVSRLVTAAYYASSDRGMAEYLDILAGIKGDPNETDSLSAAHDSGRILLKQGEFAKAEAVLVSARDALLKSSDLSLPIMSNGYIWIIKTLSLAQVHLQRQADAQQQLLDTHAKVKGAGGDDTLGMLHIEMLLASFHRNHGIEIPLLAETYDKQVADRFERMYAATKEKVLGAEGLNTALVLLSQGAQEEAVVVLALFRDASSAMLGPDHELPQRAERFRRIAEKEMEKEAENERNGDCWLRFGSAMLPRDARALDSGGQPTTKSAVSWVTEENQGAWGVRDEFEAVLVDLGVFPLPSMQVLRSLLMGSRLLQVFLFSFVVLLVSIGLVAVLR